MTQEEILAILKECGAVITDSHIVYTSGRHGSAYVNKDAIYPHTFKISMLCWEIAKRFEDYQVDVVIAPAIGGVILSQWIAFHLTKITQTEVLGVYAEKELFPLSPPLSTAAEIFEIKRGYNKLVAGKRVLVVEDVLTTGGSAKKVVEATRLCGGEVLGVGVLCNRGKITPQDLDAPVLISLVEINLDSYDEHYCPLCAAGVPINTDVGKGKEFLARKKG